MTNATEDREALAREVLAKQYDYSLPHRAAHIRAGTSDHKAIDAMLAFADRERPGQTDEGDAEDRVELAALLQAFRDAKRRGLNALTFGLIPSLRPAQPDQQEREAESAAYKSDRLWWLEIAEGKGYDSIEAALKSAPARSQSNSAASGEVEP